MRAIRFVVLAAPLIFGVACKKQAAPEPAPAAAPPAIEWMFGPASFSGSRADDAKGTLKVPVAIMNNTDNGLIMKALRLGVNGADGTEACNAKADMSNKAPGNSKIEASIDVPCSYQALPAEGPLMGKATVVYSLAGQDVEKTVDTKIKFAR